MTADTRGPNRSQFEEQCQFNTKRQIPVAVLRAESRS